MYRTEHAYNILLMNVVGLSDRTVSVLSTIKGIYAYNKGTLLTKIIINTHTYNITVGKEDANSSCIICPPADQVNTSICPVQIDECKCIYTKG